MPESVFEYFLFWYIFRPSGCSEDVLIPVFLVVINHNPHSHLYGSFKVHDECSYTSLIRGIQLCFFHILSFSFCCFSASQCLDMVYFCFEASWFILLIHVHTKAGKFVIINFLRHWTTHFFFDFSDRLLLMHDRVWSLVIHTLDSRPHESFSISDKRSFGAAAGGGLGQICTLLYFHGSN